MKVDDEMIERLAKEMEAKIFATFIGRVPTSRTALVVRGNTFVTVSTDDDEKVITPCPKCGPVFLCQEHMAS